MAAPKPPRIALLYELLFSFWTAANFWPLSFCDKVRFPATTPHCLWSATLPCPAPLPSHFFFFQTDANLISTSFTPPSRLSSERPEPMLQGRTQFLESFFPDRHGLPFFSKHPALSPPTSFPSQSVQSPFLLLPFPRPPSSYSEGAPQTKAGGDFPSPLLATVFRDGPSFSKIQLGAWRS